VAVALITAARGGSSRRPRLPGPNVPAKSTPAGWNLLRIFKGACSLRLARSLPWEPEERPAASESIENLKAGFPVPAVPAGVCDGAENDPTCRWKSPSNGSRPNAGTMPLSVLPHQPEDESQSLLKIILYHDIVSAT
jgi:hypothetical protein